MNHPRIAFIGAGNMATSLIGGLIARGVPAENLKASEPVAEQRQRIAGEHGIEVFEDNAAAVQDELRYLVDVLARGHGAGDGSSPAPALPPSIE